MSSRISLHSRRTSRKSTQPTNSSLDDTIATCGHGSQLNQPQSPRSSSQKPSRRPTSGIIPQNPLKNHNTPQFIRQILDTDIIREDDEYMDDSKIAQIPSSDPSFYQDYFRQRLLYAIPPPILSQPLSRPKHKKQLYYGTQFLLSFSPNTPPGGIYEAMASGETYYTIFDSYGNKCACQIETGFVPEDIADYRCDIEEILRSGTVASNLQDKIDETVQIEPIKSKNKSRTRRNSLDLATERLQRLYGERDDQELNSSGKNNPQNSTYQQNIDNKNNANNTTSDHQIAHPGNNTINQSVSDDYGSSGEGYDSESVSTFSMTTTVSALAHSSSLLQSKLSSLQQNGNYSTILHNPSHQQNAHSSESDKTSLHTDSSLPSHTESPSSSLSKSTVYTTENGPISLTPALSLINKLTKTGSSQSYHEHDPSLPQLHVIDSSDDDIKKQFLALHQAYTQQHLQLKTLQNQHIEATKLLSDLSQQHSALKITNTTLLQQNSSLIAENEKKFSLNHPILQKSDDIDDLLRELEELRQVCRNKQCRGAMLMSKDSTKKDRALANLQERLDSLQLIHNKTLTLCNSSQFELESAKNEIFDAKSVIHDLRGEIEELNNKDKNQDLKEKCRKYDELKNNYLILQKDYSNLETNYTNVTEKYLILQQNHETLKKNQLTESEEKYEKMKILLNKTIFQLKNEKDELKNNEITMQFLVNQNNEKITELNLKLSANIQEITTLREKLESYCNTTKDQEDNIKELTKIKSDSNAHISTLTLQNGQLLNEKRDLTTKYGALSEKYVNLEQHIEELQSKLDSNSTQNVFNQSNPESTFEQNQQNIPQCTQQPQPPPPQQQSAAIRPQLQSISRQQPASTTSRATLLARNTITSGNSRPPVQGPVVRATISGPVHSRSTTTTASRK